MGASCDACGREIRRAERRVVQGLELLLCVDPTECRQNWPVEDRRAVARFIRVGTR